jgi:hypothetical protein
MLTDEEVAISCDRRLPHAEFREMCRWNPLPTLDEDGARKRIGEDVKPLAVSVTIHRWCHDRRPGLRVPLPA